MLQQTKKIVSGSPESSSPHLKNPFPSIPLDPAPPPPPPPPDPSVPHVSPPAPPPPLPAPPDPSVPSVAPHAGGGRDLAARVALPESDSSLRSDLPPALDSKPIRAWTSSEVLAWVEWQGFVGFAKSMYSFGVEGHQLKTWLESALRMEKFSAAQVIILRRRLEGLGKSRVALTNQQLVEIWQRKGGIYIDIVAPNFLGHGVTGWEVVELAQCPRALEALGLTSEEMKSNFKAILENFVHQPLMETACKDNIDFDQTKRNALLKGNSDAVHTWIVSHSESFRPLADHIRDLGVAGEQLEKYLYDEKREEEKTIAQIIILRRRLEVYGMDSKHTIVALTTAAIVKILNNMGSAFAAVAKKFEDYKITGWELVALATNPRALETLGLREFAQTNFQNRLKELILQPKLVADSARSSSSSSSSSSSGLLVIIAVIVIGVGGSLVALFRRSK